MFLPFYIFLIVNSIYAAADTSFSDLKQQELGFHVSVENVGQGNGSVVIDKKTGKRIIVDAGSSKYPETADVALLHFSSSVSQHKPDYLSAVSLTFVVSHPDKDHLNLFVRLLEGLKSKMQNNKNIKFYLGGPFQKYLTSREAYQFFRFCRIQF